MKIFDQIMHRQMRERYNDFKNKRKAFDPGARAWFSMDRESDDETVVHIYDGIGMFGVEAHEFVKEFDAITTPRVTLRLNTPGGDVFDGMSIYNSIKRSSATVTTVIDGVAASMGSLIALAGDTVKAHDFSLYMIHEPFSMIMGTADDMRAEADVLDKITGQGVDIYNAASNLDDTEIRAAMSAETWFTAAEAHEAGFVHEIIETDDGKKAELSFDLAAIFANAPNHVSCIPDGTRDALLDRRTVEHALCDAGMTRREAKTLISVGYDKIENVRDARFDQIGGNLETVLTNIRSIYK